MDSLTLVEIRLSRRRVADLMEKYPHAERGRVSVELLQRLRKRRR